MRYEEELRTRDEIQSAEDDPIDEVTVPALEDCTNRMNRDCEGDDPVH